MPPLFACFPVCLTFVAIALIGVLVVVFGLANRIPGDDQPVEGTSRPGTGPPPWWVLPLMLLALAALMLVLAWYWPE